MKTVAIIFITSVLSFLIAYAIFNPKAPKLSMPTMSNCSTMTDQEIFETIHANDEQLEETEDYLSHVTLCILDTLLKTKNLDSLDKDNIYNIYKCSSTLISNIKYKYEKEIEPKDLFNINLSREYWLGENPQVNNERGNGSAYYLRNLLNWYFDTLRITDNEKVDIIKTKYYSENKRPKDTLNTTWESFYFSKPPVFIQKKLQSLIFDILVTEVNEMTYYAEKAKIDIKVFGGKNKDWTIMTYNRLNEGDQIRRSERIMINPVRDIIPVGSVYKAKIIRGIESYEKSKFYTTLGKTEDNILTIPADSIDNGAKKGEITYTINTYSNGNPMSSMGKFRIYTPSLAPKTETSHLLYLNCNHSLSLDLPDFSVSNPFFEITGAKMTSKNDKSPITFCPTQPNVNLMVFNLIEKNKIKLGTIEYKAIPTPKPFISFYANDKKINRFQTTVDKKSKFKISLASDPQFALQMPKEANYLLNKVEAYIQYTPEQSPQLIKQLSPNKSEIAFTLPNEVLQKPNNARIFILVKELTRLNSQGEKIPETNLSEQERTISLEVN